MRCHNAKSLISASFDEPMLEFDRSRLEDHLQSCTDCATHLNVLERGRELLQAGAQQSPPENFEWKVQLGIQKAMRDAARERYSIAPRAAFWRPLLTGALGTAALVVALGVFVLPRLQQAGSANDAPILSEANKPDVSGAQPVEIIDPLYVNSRGGQFVSSNGGGQMPWKMDESDPSDLIKEIQFLRKVIYDQDQLIQHLHDANERLTLQLQGESGGQR